MKALNDAAFLSLAARATVGTGEPVHLVPLCKVVHTLFRGSPQIIEPFDHFNDPKEVGMTKPRSHANPAWQYTGALFLGITLAVFVAQPRPALAWVLKDTKSSGPLRINF